MATSQNGWSANDRTKVSSRPVPGTGVRLTVRNGAAGDLLLEVASLFDLLVQDVDNARAGLDDWGYAERLIRGSATTVSNHASGTAVDLNATRWSLGQQASVNLNPAQIAKVREIVAATGGVVVWGAGWSRPDPMHFELARGSTAADCVRALDALRRRYGSRSDLTTPAPRPPAPQPPREDDPMAIIPIRVDAHGRFHETAMVEAGNSRYAAQASVTLGSTWGATRVTVTALDHQHTPLYSWPVELADNGFAGIDLPAAARILTFEGAVEHVTDQVDEAGNITQPATRLAVGVHTKAA